MSNHHTLPNIQYCRCGQPIVQTTGEIPRAGKGAICLACGRVYILDLHLNLQTMRAEDFKAMDRETVRLILEMKRAIRESHLTSDEIVAEIDRFFDDGDKVNFGEPDAEEVGERWDGQS